MGIAHSASSCWWDSDSDSLDSSRHLKSLDMSQLMTYYEFISATPRPIDGEPVPREPPLLHMCHGNPGETIRFNPLVLRRGTTIEMHLGHGVNFGNRPGVATAHSLPTDDFGGDVCVRYKLRNHSVMLSGPLRAKQLMQALSTGVRMEIGRNAILNTRIFGEDHQTLTEAAERFVVPEPASGIVCAMWRESALVLDVEPDPFESTSKSELFRRGESFGGYSSYLLDIQRIDPKDRSIDSANIAHYQAVWSRPFLL